MDEYLRLPCRYCGNGRSGHVGRAFVCFGGYGTVWHPKEEITDEIDALPPAESAARTTRGVEGEER